jgi:hypothetical protein
MIDPPRQCQRSSPPEPEPLFSLICTEKTAKGLTYAAEILAFWLQGGGITANNSQQEQPGLAVNRRMVAVVGASP